MKVGLFAFYPDVFRAPLWRKLASHRQLDIYVYYFTTAISSKPPVATTDNNAETADPVVISGYESRFIRVTEPDPFSAKIPDPDTFFKRELFDVVIIDGCLSRCERQIRKYAKKYHYKIILRGEMGLAAQMISNMPEIMVKTLDRYPARIRRRIDAFCPTGRNAEQRLQEQGIAPEKIFPSPFSIDTEAVKTQKKLYCREIIQKELGLPDDTFVFLFAGDITPNEYPLTVVDAILKLQDYPKIAIVFLGEGELASKVETKLRPILSERLVMPGRCDFDSSGYYFAISDVLVMPSGHGAGGPTVALAMHWEMPAIISDRCGEGGELVINGFTGFSYPDQQVDSLVRYMRKFLVDKELAVKMGLAALHAAENYTIKEGVAGIISALKFILKP